MKIGGLIREKIVHFKEYVYIFISGYGTKAHAESTRIPINLFISIRETFFSIWNYAHHRSSNRFMNFTRIFVSHFEVKPNNSFISYFPTIYDTFRVSLPWSKFNGKHRCFIAVESVFYGQDKMFGWKPCNLKHEQLWAKKKLN